MYKARLSCIQNGAQGYSCSQRNQRGGILEVAVHKLRDLVGLDSPEQQSRPKRKLERIRLQLLMKWFHIVSSVPAAPLYRTGSVQPQA